MREVIVVWFEDYVFGLWLVSVFVGWLVWGLCGEKGLGFVVGGFVI